MNARIEWTETTLGDVLTLLTDGSHFSPEVVSEGYPYVTVRDVRDGKIDLAGSARISQSAYEELVKNGCAPQLGDVLFSKDGTVGRLAQVRTNLPFVVLSSLAILRPKLESISAEFLAMVLSSDDFQGRATGSKTGLAIKRVVLKVLRTLSIPLPPLEEQKRIVDVVSSVDAYIDSLQQQVDAARTARNAVLHELLSACGDGWTETTLDELVLTGVVSLGRGNVISKKDMDADPGQYPVYSSAQNNDGRIGSYNKYMFDEELITWSVDGGGHVFYRPHHKFSVTNIGGYLRILDDSKFLYPFLAAVLQKLHGQHVFDWQNKAHPSVIRKLYNNIPLAPIEEQKRIVEIVVSMDEVIKATEQSLVEAKNLRSGLLSDLLSGEHEIPESYDSFVGAL